MKILYGLFMLLLIVAAGCAGGTYQPYPRAAHVVPSGPGTIPPEWYYDDPTLREWFNPWFHNPYY
jgi:hypothetical protein